jgi:dTDP-4-dehydrorhamnose reductase
MKRIFIAGGTGLLGSHLSVYLEGLGYGVHAMGRTSDRLVCDMTFKNDVFRVLDKINPEVIINLVALTDVDECERRPEKAYLLNTKVVENLSNWVEKNSPCYLLQISTDQVYDGKGPHNESAVMLKNYYAFSKYTGELFALKALGGVLRTNFFGRSCVNGRHSFSDWIIDNLKSRKPINVFENVFINPLLISTLCKMIALMVENCQYGVFNLGSREGFSKADFAFKLAKEFGFDDSNMTRVKLNDTHLTAYRPKDMRTNSDNFEKFFNVALPKLSDEIILLNKEYCESAK